MLCIIDFLLTISKNIGFYVWPNQVKLQTALVSTAVKGTRKPEDVNHEVVMEILVTILISPVN